jgi:DNA (cytosine-5)-methyltransferase 1
MVARIQGFPDSWKFAGKKTAAYRQIGNAFPPPVAKTVAQQLANCIRMGNRVFASAAVLTWLLGKFPDQAKKLLG